MTRILNLIQVKGHERLANLNVLILLNKGDKAVTLHLNGINAHVNQNLFARIGSNSKRVNSWSGCGNSARNRSIHNSLRRPNTQTLSKYSTCKNRIRNVL